MSVLSSGGTASCTGLTGAGRCRLHHLRLGDEGSDGGLIGFGWVDGRVWIVDEVHEVVCDRADDEDCSQVPPGISQPGSVWRFQRGAS